MPAAIYTGRSGTAEEEIGRLRRENAALKAEVAALRAGQQQQPAPPVAAPKPAGVGAAQVHRAPVVVQADDLRATVERMLSAAGSDDAEAQAVASNLVLSNLKGHDSHGVGYLPRYIRGAKEGLIALNAKAAVVAETPTTVLLDGGVGFGQCLGKQAMGLGIPKALEQGVAVVGMRNSHHLARIGAWAEQCADAGLVRVHFTNVAGHAPLVAPHNGSDARLGTNPFTVGFPCVPLRPCHPDARPLAQKVLSSDFAQRPGRQAHRAGLRHVRAGAGQGARGDGAGRPRQGRRADRHGRPTHERQPLPAAG